MSFLIIFLIFLLNAGGIGIVYLLVKEKTQMQRIIYVAASFTIMYIIALIVYVIACIGIDDVNNTYYRTNVVLLIAPINLLATVPLLIKSYKDMKKKKPHQLYSLSQLFLWIKTFILPIKHFPFFFFVSLSQLTYQDYLYVLRNCRRIRRSG